jgi:hypothetical protein
MQNALIFSSNFDGHRQIYVFVIAHVLTKMGFHVCIAGNFSADLNNTFYIDKLISDKSIIKIDTVQYDEFGMKISNSEFLELQEKYNINLTVFAEADNHIPLFISQLSRKNKRFKGRVVGIFLRPWHFYKKLNFIDKYRYIKYVRTKWQNDSRLFHEVLNPVFQLLNASLHIDEFFALNHNKSTWLPDIFQQYADKIVLEENSDQRIWIKRLDEFLIGKKDTFIFLYFGTAQQRRGYDELLKLASDLNACFIHCGLRNYDATYKYNVDELRINLRNNYNLFETNEYLTDPYCIKYFFKSVSHLVLPYQNFLGSSGVMLQALSYGIPVLVPDFGLIGYRVRRFNLGLTYSDNSLKKEFLRFVEIPKENFKNSIYEYMKYQTADRLEDVLQNTFAGLKTRFIQP